MSPISATATRRAWPRRPALSGGAVTSRYADLLEDPDAGRDRHRDAGLHALRPGRQALRAGKHNVRREAAAPSTVEANELIELAEDRDLRLMCGHTFLYSPPVRKVSACSTRASSAIYFISSSRVNLGLHQRDVSVIWDLGPHDFSILLYWLD